MSFPLVANFLREQAQGRLSACSKRCLHNIATALEMYSTDFEAYLTGEVGYNMDARFDDYFILFCQLGHPSLDVSAGYPQYDPKRGLIER